MTQLAGVVGSHLLRVGKTRPLIRELDVAGQALFRPDKGRRRRLLWSSDRCNRESGRDDNGKGQKSIFPHGTHSRISFHGT